MFSILRPYIFSLDPEVAHDLAIKSLKFNFIPSSFFNVEDEDMLTIDLFKKKMRNPIGLAAGFDKSAEVYNSLYKFGFGFIEVGTITPKKQLGNPKPRVFRLEKDKAMINRLGFNNDGLDIVTKRINNNTPTGVLGINVGPNKDTENKIEDFVKCISQLHFNADYITINISSPNTDGLRNFHEKNSLTKLFESLNKIKKEKKITKPFFVKISPDINQSDISHINELILKYKIEGIIVSNTTDKNRDSLEDTKKYEEGGLSGNPIKNLSTNLIKSFYKEIGGKIKIIGVGGVDSGKTAFEKISAGANAVQLYTGMVYKGPGVIKEIKKDLIKILKSENIKNVNDAVGINS